MGFIAADRNQLKLFGYSLDDFVRPDAKCRFVVEIVGQMDLSELYADYSDQGGDAYDPGTLLAAWFFAYSEGISSTRRLEQLCCRDMHYIYVSANLQPDHTTLSRFRQRHAGRLPDFFVQIIRLAAEQGVSNFGRISIDGSKIEAAASSRRNRSGKELEWALRRLREQIAQYLEQSELLDEEEDEEALELAQVRHKVEKLQALEQKLAEREQQLQHRKKALQSKDRSKHNINLVEPEARNMKQVNGRPAAPAYNAQLSVDAQSQLIVAAEVTDDPNDRNQFSRQHAQVGRRRSPKLGSIDQLFGELLRIPDLLADPNFSLEVLFIHEEEVRQHDPARGWRKHHWVTRERRLLDVVGRRLFETPADVAATIPGPMPEPFTTAELARALERPRWLAQQMAYCLRKMGAIEQVGWRRKSILYVRAAA